MLDELSDPEEADENERNEKRRQLIEKERQGRVQRLGSWKVDITDLY